jgi:hypothetical protein
MLGWYWILNRVQNDGLEVLRILGWYWILNHFRMAVFAIAVDLELNPLAPVKAGVRLLNR